MAVSRRAQTSAESRRLLIDAAAELFAEQGFRRTTFVDIAERAGISRGSIPWHFGNKDGLLKAVVDDVTGGTLSDAPRPVGVDDGIAHVREFLRQPTTRLLITLIAEAVEPDSPVHGFYEEFHRAMRKWVTGWTDGLAMPAGVRREEFVTVVAGAIIGVHQQWRVAPDDVDLDKTLDALKAIIGDGSKRRVKRSPAG
ncbi:TetR family transcriptional regulator [Mycobacterium sp. ACS1612]|uniref:TetR/AcrR family transcriptional regulator n=1 Tax=Mycobacterium sp. ACS1612 TaxID=1834117 RepID=UPI00080112DB|nr:TetR/AcrR family transcriptional regulator [Mycobacterium sp. ACS1612]OBF28985.1 TetR family transcriptional regulator [Mycobacterium sp. ACS1612]